MPSRVIDTAVVEIVPSFPGFETIIEREVAQTLAELQRNAEKSTEQMERSFVDLEDGITEAFEDASLSGRLELEQLGRAADDVADEMGRDFERAGEVSEDAFAELRRTANRELDRIDKDVSTASRGVEKSFGLGAIAGSAAFAGIGAAAVAGLGAVATMGLVSAAQLEQVQISFNALLGSAEKGQQVFRDLQKFAALTPFEFPEVAAAAKRFLAFNEQVGLSDDQLQSFLTTVGDLASVTGAGAEGMNRIVLALGQIASKGKVSLEELMQIGEAVPGFSAIGAIATQLGVSTGEAMEQISAGTVDATTGINALLAGMQQFPGAAGAMEKQSQTLLGVFSTFKDTVGQALADSFAPVIPAIKDALTQVTPIFGEALKVLGPALGSVLTTLLPLIGGLVQAFSPLLTALLKLLDAILKPLIPVITQIATVLGDKLTEVIMGLVPAVEELLPAFGEILIALLPLVPAILDITIALTPLIVLLAKAVAAFLEWGAAEGLVPVVKALAFVIGFVAEAVAAFVGWVTKLNWAEIGKDIGGAFVTAWNAVKNFFVGIGRFFRDLPGNIMDFIRSLPERFVNGLMNMFDLAIQAVGVGIGLLIAAFTEFPGMALDAIQALGPMVMDFLDRWWDGITTQASVNWDKFLDFIRALPGRALTLLHNFGTTVLNFFTGLWLNAVNMGANAVESIIGFFTNLPGRLAGFASSVAGGITNFIRDFLNRMITNINIGIGKVDAFIPGDLPRLPLLARGGLAFGPSIIGEDPSTGPEAAIPLGDARAMDAIASAISRAMGGGGNGAVMNNVTVIIEMDGQQFNGRIVSVMNERDRDLSRRVRARTA